MKNLRRKLRPKEEHKLNSPWNIAADFNVDMSFSKDEIAAMLGDYESDHKTGMDIEKIAGLIFDYTSGYPFLVSRICQLMDEEVWRKYDVAGDVSQWTSRAFHEVIKILLSEKNTLFESLVEKVIRYPELKELLEKVLFTGKQIAYNYYHPVMNIATMFGFVKDSNNCLTVANRIFEVWLYNYYLSSSELQGKEMYSASLRDKNQFIVNGHLNMKHILQKFVEHFHDLYGDRNEAFVEEEGRKYFLLYLRPIINGTGNYYIESRTRDMRRTDVIVDYCGEQYIIEMKIWHGNEYNERGEKQLLGYLEDYHQEKGYMLSFNFNKKKEIGIKEIVIDGKMLIEAVV